MAEQLATLNIPNASEIKSISKTVTTGNYGEITLSDLSPTNTRILSVFIETPDNMNFGCTVTGTLNTTYRLKFFDVTAWNSSSVNGTTFSCIIYYIEV